MTYFHTLDRQCTKPILFLVSLVTSTREIYLTQTQERKFTRLLGEGHKCPCKELSCPWVCHYSGVANSPLGILCIEHDQRLLEPEAPAKCLDFLH